MSVESRGGLPTPRRACGPGRDALWGGGRGPPPGLPFWLRVSLGKIGGLPFVSSNSENIARTAFLEPKNSRKQELALWHLVNRLVPENV